MKKPNNKKRQIETDSSLALTLIVTNLLTLSVVAQAGWIVYSLFNEQGIARLQSFSLFLQQ